MDMDNNGSIRCIDGGGCNKREGWKLVKNASISACQVVSNGTVQSDNFDAKSVRYKELCMCEHLCNML